MGMTNKTHQTTPTIAVTAGAYSDGDVVGGLINLSDIVGAGGGGTIRSILVVDNAAQAANIDFYFFDTKPEIIADNAAFAFSDPDGEWIKHIGKKSLSSYNTYDSISVGLVEDVNVSHGNGQLWCYAVLNGSTPTYAATSDIQIKFTGWVD